MQTQNRVGQQFGNYELTQLIGSGGYAEVYLAKHTHIPNLQHAIKILTGTNLQEEQRESFIAEASTIANLQNLSTHIVQLHGFGIQTSGNVAEDGIPYIVMEYAAGGTLRKIYPSGTEVPLERIVFYTKQVAEALQCAHDQKPPIVHRDIKPENMLLRSRDHLLLSDFGIAVSGNTASHVITVKEKELVGTVTYMAPERFSKSTRRASDQYSLGIVVYEWLSGSPPFDGSDREVMYKQLMAPPPELNSQYPHISKEIEDVVMCALEKAPEDRYPTVKEFADALEKAVQNTLQRNQLAQYPAGNVGQSQGNKPARVITPQIQSLLPSNSSPLPIAPSSPTPPSSSISSYPVAFSQSQPLPSVQSPQPSSPSPSPAPSSPIPSYPVAFSQPQSSLPSNSLPSPVSPPASLYPSAFPQSQPQPPVLPTPQVQQPSVLPSQPFDYTGVTELIPPKQGQPLLAPTQPLTPSAPAKPSLTPAQIWSSPAPAQTWSSPAPAQTWSSPVAAPNNNRRRRNFFDFSTQFLWNSESTTFIYGGLILNVLSAIGIGILQRNIITLVEGLAFSLLMFMLCICAVEMVLSIFFGILVALYWLAVGWLLGNFLAESLHLNQSPPSLYIGFVFFVVSFILHIRYASRKNA